MKPYIVSLALIVLGVSPASAQIAGWKATPQEAAYEAARTCQIQPTFVTVERAADGRLLYQVSPTVTGNQLSCVKMHLSKYGVNEQKK